MSSVAILTRMAARSPKPSDVLLAVVSANVQRLLEHKHLTQSAAARKKHGIGQPQLSKIVKQVHSPDTATLGKLAETLEVPPWCLLVRDLNPADLPRLVSRAEMERLVAEGMRQGWERINAELKAQLQVPHDGEKELRPSVRNPYPAVSPARAIAERGKDASGKPTETPAATKRQLARRKT